MLRNAGAQTEQLQPLSSLVITVHAATSMVCFPAAGLVTDRLRARKTALVVGLVVFSTATFWFFQASSVTGMLLAKGIQGGSSSLLWVASLAWCFDVSDSGKKGTVIGLVMSANDVGSLLAPPLGGLIYTALGQPLLCTVSLLVLVLGLGCTLAVSERAEKQELGSPRWRQPISTESDSSGTVGPSAASPANHDRKYGLMPSRHWLLSRVPILRCLADPALVVSILVCTVQAALLGVLDASIPLATQQLFDLSVSSAGFFFIPVGLARLLAGPIGGWLVDHYGSKCVGVAGYSFLVLPLLLFDSVESTPRGPGLFLYCTLLALSGVGMGIVSTVSFVEAGKIVERYHDASPGVFGETAASASLYGLNLMVYSLGMAVGSALAGDFQLVVGFGNMMAVIAAISCAAAFACRFGLESSDGICREMGGEKNELIDRI
ncbi:hypothetical protein PG996_009882 [Apiospora saccharicola]|uniref:Major facilitator superfamily (MFS) profile domain-containing protein n=1 Tax=Apiospora saccharicola TaxID=335842 RepID=A0ABR1UM19_9PEZI